MVAASIMLCSQGKGTSSKALDQHLIRVGLQSYLASLIQLSHDPLEKQFTIISGHSFFVGLLGWALICYCF